MNVFLLPFSFYFGFQKPIVSDISFPQRHTFCKFKYSSGFGPRKVFCSRMSFYVARAGAPVPSFSVPRGSFLLHATPNIEGESSDKKPADSKPLSPLNQADQGLGQSSVFPTAQAGRKTTYTQNLSSIDERFSRTEASLDRLLKYQTDVANGLLRLDKQVEITNSDIQLLNEITRKQLETTTFLQQLDKTDFNDTLAQKLMDLTCLFISNQEKWLIQMEKNLSSSKEMIEILNSYGEKFQKIETILIRAGQAGELKINDILAIFKKEILPFLESFKSNQVLTNGLLQNLVLQAQELRKSVSQTETLPIFSSGSEVSVIHGETQVTNVPLEVYGISQSEFQILQEKSLPILRKMRDGQNLSPNEHSFIKGIPYNLIALLVGRDGAADNSGFFTFEPGSVFKLIITVKDLNVFKGESVIALSQTKEVLATPKSFQMMNCLEYSENLYFIVLTNKNTLSLKQVLDSFAENLFSDGLSYMMNKLVFLESLQIQKVYPEPDNQALPQVSYSLGGKLTVDLFPTCPRPFVLTQMPAYLTGARNKYSVRFHGVADAFFDSRNQPSPMFQMGLSNIATFLRKEIVFGRNQDLILRNCVQTRKLGSPLSFVPVAEITIGSFISNSNPQNKKRGLAPYENEEGDGNKKSIS